MSIPLFQSAGLATSTTPTGAAGGDLGGTYPNPTVLSVADVTTGRLLPANGGTASISVSDQGYFISTNLSQAGLATATAAVVGAAQQVRACQFVLPFRITVSKITAVIVGTVAASTVTAGIYDAAGTTKLIDSGTFDGSSATTQTKTITPVTLNPGAYFFAQSASTQTTLTATTIQGGGGVAAVINNDTNKLCGVAANAAVAGVLPSALGAITATNYAFLVAGFKP